jgi:hypothetical protein
VSLKDLVLALVLGLMLALFLYGVGRVGGANDALKEQELNRLVSEHLELSRRIRGRAETLKRQDESQAKTSDVAKRLVDRSRAVGKTQVLIPRVDTVYKGDTISADPRLIERIEVLEQARDTLVKAGAQKDLLIMTLKAQVSDYEATAKVNERTQEILRSMIPSRKKVWLQRGLTAGLAGYTGYRIGRLAA